MEILGGVRGAGGVSEVSIEVWGTTISLKQKPWEEPGVGVLK